MEQRESYQLIASYVKKKYFISTMYREASTMEPMWYFETIVWEWDAKTRRRGKMLEQENSGIDEEMALDSHCALVKKFNCAYRKHPQWTTR